ncbi:MAG TPA: DUF3429 domain-containing protein [Noviherbaspirillum sp.]|jgi:hypothetical protein|uniref:DUF3429 domain-containing protein n=1 Tax=Noviherbaspirillum sp. TaxID=1926288 RepID=UPI002F956282
MNSRLSDTRLPAMLALCGMLPFVLLMLACWVVDAEWLGFFIRGQLAWGIAILSFSGGIHWGAAFTRDDLTPEQTRSALVWGILPVLIAWGSTLAGGFGFAMLMAGFVLAYQADKRQFGCYRLPAWLLALRLKLTAAIVFMLALTVIAANIRG